jgi:hypothetical protein
MFLQLGTNPRSCATCHAPDQGWTMTADANKELFKESDGLAPLFNLVDEGNRPDADISTKDARKATFNPQTVKLALTRFTRNISADRRGRRPVQHHGGGGSVRLPVTTSSFLNFRRPTHMANETKMSSILNTSDRCRTSHDARDLMNGAARPPRAARRRRQPGAADSGTRATSCSLFFAQISDNRRAPRRGGALGGPPTWRPSRSRSA